MHNQSAASFAWIACNESDSNKIVFILTVHAFEPSPAWQRQALPLELPKLLDSHESSEFSQDVRTGTAAEEANSVMGDKCAVSLSTGK